MSNFQHLTSENPFNVPFTLGEFLTRLSLKLEKHPAQLFTDKEIMQFAEDIIKEMCNNTNENIIKQKALEWMLDYMFLSLN